MLTPDQQVTYEGIRKTALADIEALDREILAELARVKRRLLDLQESKKAVTQILDGASARLGLPKSTASSTINVGDLSHDVDMTEEVGAGA